MARLTHKQAVLVGRIRDAFDVLGLTASGVTPGTPGTAADLAIMAPVVGRFAAQQGAAFAEKIRATRDLDARAAMIADAADAVVKKLPVTKVVTAVDILGKGFLAYRKAKQQKDKMATLVGVVDSFTAALSR